MKRTSLWTHELSWKSHLLFKNNHERVDESLWTFIFFCSLTFMNYSWMFMNSSWSSHLGRSPICGFLRPVCGVRYAVSIMSSWYTVSNTGCPVSQVSGKRFLLCSLWYAVSDNYAVSNMRSPPICRLRYVAPLHYTVPSVMNLSVVCGPLQYKVPSVMHLSEVCGPFQYTKYIRMPQ